jgi:hypothetical protein
MNIINLPPRQIININKKPRSNNVYTIHHIKTTNPFILKQDVESYEDEDNVIGSTVISFKREIDALNFTYMIESHKQNTNEWPSTTYTSLNSLFVVGNFPNYDYNPRELFLKTWDVDTLSIYCATNILNMFVLHSITQKPDNVYAMKGEYYKMTLPSENYAYIFENMLQREYIKDIDDEWN